MGYAIMCCSASVHSAFQCTRSLRGGKKLAIKINLADAIENTTITQRIGRSIVYTICDGHQYVNGEPYDFTDTLLGKWTAKRATRSLRKKHDDETITIAHTTVYKQYCDMDLLDFWLNARATSDPKQVAEFFIND